MDLNNLIENLIALQKQGLGKCDVVVQGRDEKIRISNVRKEIIYYVPNEDEEYHSSLNFPVYDSDDPKIEDKEILINISTSENWEFKCQEKENEKELQILKEREKLGINTENLCIKDKVLFLLKKGGLGESRGFSPRYIKEITNHKNVRELRDTICQLASDNLIGSTGGARRLRYVAIEFLEEAKEIYKNETQEHFSVRI